MKEWTVGEVAKFFEDQDAAGVATCIQSNAVNGTDLFDFTDKEQVLQELNVTPFLAKKICSLRDAFLTSTST